MVSVERARQRSFNPGHFFLASDRSNRVGPVGEAPEVTAHTATGILIALDGAVESLMDKPIGLGCSGRGSVTGWFNCLGCLSLGLDFIRPNDWGHRT
jgi:hypothetical protein